jgi:signal transduction histidine kinase
MMLGSAHSAGDRPLQAGPSCASERARKEIAWWRCRRSLERQLHDGAALRISALTLRLGLLQESAPGGSDLGARIGELQEELHAVLEELRDLAGKLYPPLLDRAGLGPALREVADQLETPVEVVVTGERFGPAVEGAAYFAIAEFLAALPARPHEVTLEVRQENNDLMLSVSGGDPSHAELLARHARPLGGTVAVAPGVARAGGVGAPQRSTSTITARIPCE